MAGIDTTDDGVWQRVYLALLGYALLAIGLLAQLVGEALGGLVARQWSPWLLLAGLVAVAGAVVGGRFARFIQLGLGGLLVIVALGTWAQTVFVPLDGAALPLLVVALTGVAALWMGRRPAPTGAAAGVPRERWWRRRWWVVVVALGFPFAFGASAAFLTVVGGGAPAGCDEAGGRVLQAEASALSEQIPGLVLGEMGGCDSGDAAWIDWEHDSLPAMRASALAGDCREHSFDEGDGPESYLVCGDGLHRISVYFDSDRSDGPGSGSISLGDG